MRRRLTSTSRPHLSCAVTVSSALSASVKPWPQWDFNYVFIVVYLWTKHIGTAILLSTHLLVLLHITATILALSEGNYTSAGQRDIDCLQGRGAVCSGGDDCLCLEALFWKINLPFLLARLRWCHWIWERCFISGLIRHLGDIYVDDGLK